MDFNFNEFMNSLAGYFSEIFEGIYIKVLLAILVFFIGLIIGRIVTKVLHKFLHDVGLNGVLKRVVGKEYDIEKRLSLVAEYSVYLLTAIIVLNQLGVTKVIVYILFSAAVVVIIISSLLTMKDFLPNAIAGLHIYRKKIIKKGNMIDINGIKGRVIGISLVETKIKTKEGNIVYAPNLVITKAHIKKDKKKKKKKN
ncbi:MAG: mechanosensitive ion channel [Candidatus Woesearchaeota archaeon]|nr:mechanosensitive ion channel [Candidatus Woesearchaeota archaeon]